MSSEKSVPDEYQVFLNTAATRMSSEKSVPDEYQVFLNTAATKMSSEKSVPDEYGCYSKKSMGAVGTNKSFEPTAMVLLEMNRRNVSPAAAQLQPFDWYDMMSEQDSTTYAAWPGQMLSNPNARQRFLHCLSAFLYDSPS
jgi:hypothetical protein